MDIRPITPAYAVSPQIAPEDIPAIAAAGFALILCNRPDGEVPPGLQADDMRRATEAAGLEFAELAVTHDTLSVELAAKQAAIVAAAPGPVLAYCASGTRCSIVWSFMQAGHLDTDAIIAATTQAGYQLEMLRPQLDEIAAR